MPPAGFVELPAEPAAAQAAAGGEAALDRHVLDMLLEPGETGFLRRSSLILAQGDFEMTTRRIASRAVPILGLFSGQNLWANRFDAGEGGARVVGCRDYHGIALGLPVTEAVPVFLQPALYLGHRGALTFTVKRVAKREFWTLTRVTGEGTVYIKAPGRAFSAPLSQSDLIVDTNYVAAVRGRFDAHGRVFRAGQYLRSGEAENVRITGEGDVLLQTELPPESGGGGGILDSLLHGFF